MIAAIDYFVKTQSEGTPLSISPASHTPFQEGKERGSGNDLYSKLFQRLEIWHVQSVRSFHIRGSFMSSPQ